MKYPSFVISEKMVDHFFEMIPKIEPDEELWRRTIDLFGGEPLLKENKDRIKYIIKKGKERGFKFSATSNGYDLVYYEELLSTDAIGVVQVTIDGSKYVHDSRRVHVTEIGSFDVIINNIEMSLRKGISIIVRINIDNTNVGEVVKLDKYFREKGFYLYDSFMVYAAYLGGEVNFNPETYNNEISLSGTYDDFFEVFKNKDHKVKHNYTLYNRLYNAIESKKSIPLSSCHCDSHYSNYVFDPLGNIYTCLELVGKKEHSIGTYNRADLKWNENAARWQERNISSIAGCNRCKYTLLCGGGCFAKVLRNPKCGDSYCGDFSTILGQVCNEVYFDLMNPYV
ncbi:radical SAM protein [Bacteroides reticulotermitis]